jgi:hypothetical protein
VLTEAALDRIERKGRVHFRAEAIETFEPAFSYDSRDVDLRNEAKRMSIDYAAIQGKIWDHPPPNPGY